VVSGNYRAVVEYDGTCYSGFQIQPDRPTIQGELERALQRITQEDVTVIGAGRTDAGGHARGQVISFRTAWRHDCETLQRAMNAVLPRDISLRELSPAADCFHARFSATSRAYIYSVYEGRVRAPLMERFAYHVAVPLDLEAMGRAAACLEGEHDFAAFGQPPIGTNTVRVVYRARWDAGVAKDSGGCVPSPIRPSQFEIEANAFLRGMVRRLVGTLLLVGSGLLTEDGLREILASRDISRAGVPVPACGLCLWRVCYDSRVDEISYDQDAPLRYVTGHDGQDDGLGLAR